MCPFHPPNHLGSAGDQSGLKGGMVEWWSGGMVAGRTACPYDAHSPLHHHQYLIQAGTTTLIKS